MMDTLKKFSNGCPGSITMLMKGNFIAASANISEIGPAADGFPIIREIHDNTHLNTLMSNSFGFGGTNCTLVFCRWKN